MVDDLLHSSNIADIRRGIESLKKLKATFVGTLYTQTVQLDIQRLEARILHLGGTYDNR